MGETDTPSPEIRKMAATAPALEKGLDIIELLAATGRPMPLREVADHLGRSKNELFRMAHVLIQRGYIMREGTDGLVLTNKLFEIGLKTPRTRNLVALATPMIQRLAREVRQSVHLIVANRGETVVIASASGSDDMHFALKLGYRRPLADAHSGLVILAFQSEDRRERLLVESARLMRTAPDRDVIEAELRAIRRDGYIVRGSRDLVGVTDIIAPIVLRDGEAIATLAVSCLDRRETLAGEHEAMLTPLLHVCGVLSRSLDDGSAPTEGAAGPLPPNLNPPEARSR